MERRSLLGVAACGGLLGLGGSLPSWAAEPASQGAEGRPWLAIHPWSDKGQKWEVEFLADGASIGKMAYVSEDGGLQRKPGIQLALPPQCKQLQLRGTATLPKGRAQRITGSWRIANMAPVTRALYDESLEMPDRMKAFHAALNQWGKTHGEDAQALRELMKVEPTSQSALGALAAQEKQWNLRLPPAVHQMMRVNVSLDDSYYLKPDALNTVAKLLVQWGGKLNGFDPQVRARYERSVAVFVEVGDGLGCIAWDPKGVAAGERSELMIDQAQPAIQLGKAGEGVWFSVHQETEGVPQLFLDSKMQPVGAAQALLNPLQTLLLQNVADLYAQDASSLVVDSSNPLYHVQLSLDDGRPVLRQRSYEDYSPLARAWL